MSDVAACIFVCVCVVSSAERYVDNICWCAVLSKSSKCTVQQ